MDKHWIPVLVRRPVGTPIVLMYLANKQFVVDHFTTKYSKDRVEVTHWQPLIPPAYDF